VSKVPYTINVNEYICSELETIRKMIKTHDFSMLPAVTERIQFHATAMESALYRYDGIRYTIKNLLKEELTDTEFREKVKSIMENVKDIGNE